MRIPPVSINVPSTIAALIMASCLAAAPATRPVTGLLLDTNGDPAKHATVVLIAAGCGEDVANGQVKLDADGQATATDDAGRFAFGPTTRPAGSLVAVTPNGRAFALNNELTGDHPLRLVPYSYVEGTVRLRGHVAGGERVEAWSFPTDGTGSSHGMFAWTVTADADGHFRVPVIGGEDCEVGRVQPLKWTENMPRSDRVSVPRGATAHADIGGGGRLVTFNVKPPKGFTFKSAMVYVTPRVAKIATALPEWPADSIHWDKPRQDAFLDAWKTTAAAKSAAAEETAKYRARNRLYYYGGCDTDGHVQLADVLPGKYMLMVTGTGMDAGGNRKSLDYYQPAMVTPSPAGNPDEPLSWAEVHLGFRARLYQGDVAPDFDFTSFDGGRVKLSDYRGKVLLVHFWATWCGPCRGAMPFLKAVDDRFGNDPRFVSIHIAEDDTMPPAQRFVTAEQIKGIQAWSGPADESASARAYGAEAIPAMILIGPDGKVLAVTTAENVMTEVEKALRAPR